MGLADLIPVEARTAGLSDVELANAQEAAGELFPPDLCELLAETLPVGRQFPDWRSRPREAMDWFRTNLIEGIHFDVLENGSPECRCPALCPSETLAQASERSRTLLQPLLDPLGSDVHERQR